MSPLRTACATAALMAGMAAAGCATAGAPTTAADVLRGNQRAMGRPPAAARAMEADFTFEGMGLSGTVDQVVDLKDGRHRSALHAGPITQADGFDTAHGWAVDPSGTVSLQDGGDQHALAVNEAYRDANLWWRPDRGGGVIESLGTRADDGVAYDVLSVKPRDGAAFEAWFDAATHLLARTVERQDARMVTTTLTDYRAFDGWRVPRTLVVDDGSGAKYRQTLRLTGVRFLAEAAAGDFGPPKAARSDAAIQDPARETSLPFVLRNNHIYADVRVNGQGPYAFLFDTGAVNALTPATAKALGLSVQGRIDAMAVGGVAETGFAKVDLLDIAAARIGHQLFLVVGLDTLSDVEGVKESGLIGFETFSRFVTRIDYGRGVLTLIEPKAFDPAGAGTPVHFDFLGNSVVIAGTFEGRPCRFAIDTGARDELTLTGPFAERTGLAATHAGAIAAVTGWGAGGPSHGRVFRAGPVRLGEVTVPQVVTSLSTDAKGAFSGAAYDGNVGGGLLKRFIVTFDYPHQMMYLKALATPPEDAGVYDRAGLWFNLAGDAFRIVDVTPTGPAERAGLRAGDLITAVDGTPAKAMALYDLRRQLRDRPAGAQVTFDIVRDAKPLRVTLTLRDLI